VQVAAGLITKEVGEAASKKLRTELDKLVDKLDATPNHDIEIELTKDIKIHLKVPDQMSKAQSDSIFGIVKTMIDNEVAKGEVTKEEAEAALKKLRAELDKLIKDGQGVLDTITFLDTISIRRSMNGEFMDDEEILTNFFDDAWKKMIDWLNTKGRFGVIAGKLLNKYRGKVGAMLKKILKTEAAELIGLIEKVKDDVIKIIKGGHIDVMNDVMNDEGMLDSPFDDLWKKIIDWLNSKGHYGQIAVKLLNKYKGKVEVMLKKILKTEAQELIKLIDDIKADIIKIIKGGHIDVMNDEEMLGNPIDDLWNKMIKWLNTKGRYGVIAGKLLNKYRGKVEAMLKKILKTEAAELITLIEKVKDDVIKIIKGGHIDPTKLHLHLLN